MRFAETSLVGVFVVEVDSHVDERGTFARTFSADEFAAHGLPTTFVQCSISRNPLAGTLRGLHYQAEPEQETKLVRCIQGAVFDVAVDLREDSSTFCNWFGVELTAGNQRSMFIPKGCAHGFITLDPDSEMYYQMGTAYDSRLARGVRWDDPAFSIDWPAAPARISDRDASYPDFRVRPPMPSVKELTVGLDAIDGDSQTIKKARDCRQEADRSRRSMHSTSGP